MNDDSTYIPDVDETLRRDFEDAWRLGAPRRIEQVVGADRDHLETLEELVHIELEFAWKHREPVHFDDENADPLFRPQVEDYLRRFPVLGTPEIVLRLVEQEYRVRASQGDTPTLAEFAERFRTILSKEQLTTRLEQIRRPQDRLPRIPGYDIIGVLGRGGMGIVYKARHQKLNRIVAIKMLLDAVTANPEEVQRFRDEAAVVAQLRHTNIVQIYDVGEHEGSPYFTLEFVEAGTLADRFQSGPMSPPEAAAMVRTLAEAIDEVHKLGIVHRDLKPANVLIDHHGVLKVGDFGLAKNLDVDGQTHTGAVMGTPSYMAPEQAAARHTEISPATDVYALGAILYHALTGTTPFRGETPWDVVQQLLDTDPVPPRQLQSKCPRDIETICLKCLHKSPSRRYASAAELSADLERFLNNEPIDARPTGALEKTLKWARRRPATAALIVVTAVAMLTITLGSLYYSSQLREQTRRIRVAKGQADANARVANEQAQLALSTLRGVVFDIQRELNGKMGMQPLQQQLLERARLGLDRVARSAATAKTADYTTATTFAEISGIYEMVGRSEEAESFAAQAVDLFTRLHDASPQDQKTLTSLATTLGDLAEIQIQRGRLDEAEATLLKALERRQMLLDASPPQQRIRNRQLLIAGQLALAKVIDQQGGTHDALQAYTDCIDQFEALREEAPDMEAAQVNLAGAYAARGYLRLTRTSAADGLQDMQQAMLIRRQLLDAAPEEERMSYETSLAYSALDLGRAYEALGDTEKSLEAWQQCLDISRRWSAADPLSTVAQQSLAHALTGLANAQMTMGKLQSATELLEEADQIRERLHRQDSADAHAAAYRAVALGQLAAVRLLMGDAAGAEQAAEAAEALTAKLAAKDLTNEVMQRDLLAGRARLADVYRTRGRLDDALKLARLTRDAVEELRQRRPRDLRLLSIAVGVYHGLGDTYRAQQDFPAAMEAYESCLGVAKALESIEPDAKATLNALEVAYDRIGDIESSSGNFAAAESAYQKSLEVSRQRWELDPQNSTARRYVALSHEKLARMHVAAEQTDKARVEYQNYLDIMNALVEQNPDNAVFLHERAAGYNLFGNLQRDLGETAAAIQLYQRSEQASRDYIEQFPAHAYAQIDLAIALEKQAMLVTDTARLLALYEEATALRRQTAEATPDLSSRRAWATNLILWGQALLKAGDAETALARFEQAGTIRQANLDHIANLTTLREVGFVHLRRGEAYVALENPAAAQDAFRQSISLFQQASEQSPTAQTSMRRNLAIAHYQLAQSQYDQHDFAEAAANFETAATHATAAGNDKWQQQFNHQQQLAEAAQQVFADLQAADNISDDVVLDVLKLRGLSLVKKGDHQAAAATAAKLTELRQEDPIAWHAAARMTAYCQQIARADKARSDEYAMVTFQYLAKMREHGYFTVAREARLENLQTDPAFAGLKDSPPWQEFLATP